jgi:hypothetical protein
MKCKPWKERELEIGFSFLGEGNVEAEIFKDEIDASRNVEDCKIEKEEVSTMTKHKVKLVSGGGGWLAIIKKKSIFNSK